jgi:tetratricopeptide (TPR) repeat protein
MKRTALIFIALLFAISTLTAFAQVNSAFNAQVGDIVFLGSYEQDNNEENGQEAIEWLVADIQGDHALIVSKHALDCQPFNDENVEASWEASAIRLWLEDVFLTQAFTDVEQELIVPVEETNGRVFLLSQEEATEIFSEAEGRKLTGTEYARANGAKFLGFTTLVIGETDWWLRSAGEKANEAVYIDVKGNLGSKRVTDKLGIRPALWVKLDVDRSYFPYEQYIVASNLEKDGNHGEAAEIYESLGTYNGSHERAMNCRYLQAVGAMEVGDFHTALRLFESLCDYQDSYTNGRACRYAIAVDTQESGDYKEAIKLFEKVGQYQDSMEQLKACYEKLGISIYYFSNGAVETGVDTGYSRANTIEGKDKHFGWRMGRFFMSGFTRVSDGASEQPIFIKTLGDSITLWFDLEQNIDALGGNEKLVINEDENGYDQYFGVKKTNFGRGTLVVRHTDYQNNNGEPQIYTDYLLAKGTSGADTKIVLNEEGDYEIALNYELKDNDLKNITNKYGNYRIFIKFSVRNGNCIVFPFDVLTGTELQNTSVTENGFYLDLARSRYLDIDVKRSVIVQGPAGMIEDERFNRPAKDGDQYTAEGIYTISVSNRYTGESTVKTIFVGSDELLQEYISNGFSTDRLK